MTTGQRAVEVELAELRPIRPLKKIGPRRKTHCPRGHEYTPENVIERINSRGLVERKCRPCKRERQQKYERAISSANRRISELEKQLEASIENMFQLLDELLAMDEQRAARAQRAEDGLALLVGKVLSDHAEHYYNPDCELCDFVHQLSEGSMSIRLPF